MLTGWMRPTCIARFLSHPIVNIRFASLAWGVLSSICRVSAQSADDEVARLQPAHPRMKPLATRMRPAVVVARGMPARLERRVALASTRLQRTVPADATEECVLL